jgi:uncharacterized Zn finger protein
MRVNVKELKGLAVIK